MLELMPPFYFLTFAKVSVSVSKKFGLKKVSVSVSMKFFGLVTQCSTLARELDRPGLDLMSASIREPDLVFN